MKKIDITIDDSLTPEQEVFAIAKQLSKKLILSGNDKKLLGTGYTIKEAKTQININRVFKEKTVKPIKTYVCPICQTIVDSKLHKPLFSNYGGSIKKHRLCSNECRDALIDICGEGRTSKTRNFKTQTN